MFPDIKKKTEKFNKMYDTIMRTLHNKLRTETMIKLYKIMTVPE